MKFLILVVYLFIIFSSTSNLHMFQLNSYKNKTHLKWIFNNYLKCYRIGKNKNAKKPIVNTRRMFCLKLTIIVIAVIIISLIGMGEYNSIFFAIGMLIIHPYLPIIANIINFPLEYSIRNGYIKDAKKILKSMPNLKIIGITGSYGKTSMKYFLTTLLEGKFETLMTPESFNTPMGVVKTIREKLKGTHEIFVCEMGARQQGDIKELCDIVNPKYGIITSIGEQHLETFKTLETIVKTKFELAENINVLFANYDNEQIINQCKNINKEIVSYGIENGNIQAYDIKVTTQGSVFKVRYGDKIFENLQVKLVGSHNIQNLTGAIAAALYFGVSESAIRERLRFIKPPPHRLEIKRQNGITILDDAYNSNPAGCKAALDTLKLFDGVLILITPGMVELGEMQFECNKNFGKQAAEVCDFIYLIGEKQTVPILEGLREKGYPEDKIIILENVKDAINQAFKIDGEKIILLENDLPDNYL